MEKYGSQGGYKKLLLAGINYGGLEKPNARFVYLPNNGHRWHTVSATDFDGVIKELEAKYDINTKNMTLLGHSARRTSSGTICKRF